MTDRLFISHASEDEAVANKIVAYLEARGVACWISSRDIPPRAIYADAIVEGMQSCTACAVLVSAASNASKAVKREVELASHEDKAFIPIGTVARLTTSGQLLPTSMSRAPGRRARSSHTYRIVRNCSKLHLSWVEPSMTERVS
ncbi:MAG: hypothetical protein A4S17_05820 [Proteobacteria bacterium HN_bin10]|nr:MAG: hypothetical protein A4S17_05820 [Proteobacteria bacterium HN_bin10]